MNHRQFVVQVGGSAFLLLLLVACGAIQTAPAPTSTPIPEPTATPTPVATEAATEWNYVALGDSEPACCGVRSYPQYFADFIEEDLDVKVTLHNLAVGGLDSKGLLRLLETEAYRSLISEAQVVTLVITIGDLLACPQGDQACAEERLVVAMDNYATILEEMLALASPDDTIIRAQTYDNPFVNRWKEQGVFEERTMVDRWNQEIMAVASRYGIPVGDVYHDFNGPNGDEDPGDKGYVHTDQFHSNEAGALRMAELLRALGYEPLVR